MRLYSGMDLHSTNTYTAIMDENRKRVIDQRLPNQPKVILDFLEPYRADLEGIVIESTPTQQTLLESLNDSRCGGDSSHDDPLGNRLHHSFSKSGQLCLLLSLGRQPTN